MRTIARMLRPIAKVWPRATVEIKFKRLRQILRTNREGQVTTTTTVQLPQDHDSVLKLKCFASPVSLPPGLFRNAILELLHERSHVLGIEEEERNNIAQGLEEAILRYRQNRPWGFRVTIVVNINLWEVVDEVEEAEAAFRERFQSARANTGIGALTSFIKKLTMEKKVDDFSVNDGTCVVCLEELSSEVGGAKLMRMPCKHMFHESCICRWLENNNSCPVCRSRAH